MTKEDLELFDQLIKKNFETERIHTARLILESEKRTGEKIETSIEASEERLRSEILSARTEAKTDNLHILGKLDKQNKN